MLKIFTRSTLIMPGYSAYTDNELSARLRESDTMAFTEIHKRYYSILYKFAYRSLPDAEEAKDLLQEVFFYLWKSRLGVDAKKNLRAYLYIIVRHHLLNRFRTSKVKSRYIESLQSYLDNYQPEADQGLYLKETARILATEIAKLAPQTRLVFELSRNAELSHKEIAEKLNISTLTVRKHINNSLKVLRLKLSGKYFTFFL